jgi:hypothetical protein
MYFVRSRNSRGKPDFLTSCNFDAIQMAQHPVILRGAPGLYPDLVGAPRKISTDTPCTILIDVFRQFSSHRLRMNMAC